jgi:hypothetical protein
MKYSILLPYYKRPELRKSLASFVRHYEGRNDYEVIIVEDSKNAMDPFCSEELLRIIDEFKNEISIRHFIDPKVSFSPCHKYNLGAGSASGEFLVLSSPEIIHESDVLGGFDTLLAEDRNNYVVCACKAMNKGEFYMWYQHSKIRNVLFHFCSVISWDNYENVGGFNERYCAGIGFDDEDLVSRLIANGIKIIPRDDLVTIHQEHDKEYIDNHRELVEVNRNLFLESRE